MQTKRKLLIQFFTENRLTIITTFAVSLFSNIFSIIIPVSIGKYYNLVFGLNARRSQILNFLPEWLWNTVPRFLTFFIALVFLKIIFDFFQRFQICKIGEKMLLDIRSMLFRAQLEMPMQVYDEKGIGKYLLRHSGDLKSIKNYITKGIIGFAVDVLLLVLVLVAIGTLDKGLFLIMVLFLPLFGGMIFIMNRALQKRSLEQRNVKSGLLSYVNTTLRCILSIKVFNRLNPELNRYGEMSERVYEAGMRYHQIHSAVMAVIPGLFYVSLFAVLVYSYYQHQTDSSKIDAGALLTSILLLITAMPVFRRALRVSTVWELGKISFAKLLLVLNQSREEELAISEFKCRKGEIALQNVCFHYPGTEQFLCFSDDVIGACQTTLIKGRSGAGKTTLMKLLTGIYLPSKGKILIDGQNISRINKKSLRKSITVVSEDWPLVGRNVFQAISYSRKVEKKPGAAAVLDLVQKGIPDHLKLKLETKIGELGSNLSKGQKKLLSYTRAILTDKPIMIIDEPFSGLDEAVQCHIAKLINGLKTEKTIIILDQRAWENILDIDRIISISQPEQEALRIDN